MVLVGIYLAWIKVLEIYPRNPYRGFVLGSALCYMVVLIGTNVHPFTMTLNWIPVLALMMGLSEVIIHQFKQETVMNYE